MKVHDAPAGTTVTFMGAELSSLDGPVRLVERPAGWKPLRMPLEAPAPLFTPGDYRGIPWTVVPQAEVRSGELRYWYIDKDEARDAAKLRSNPGPMCLRPATERMTGWWAVVERGTPEVRLLSLWQPWVSLVSLGHKRNETRSWSTEYRGWVAIHAAKAMPRVAQDFASELVAERLIPSELPVGCIVAVAWLRNVVPTEVAKVTDHERRFGNYLPGRFVWHFDERRLFPLAEPLNYRGAQGLRRLPADVVAQLPLPPLET